MNLPWRAPLRRRQGAGGWKRPRPFDRTQDKLHAALQLPGRNGSCARQADASAWLWRRPITSRSLGVGKRSILQLTRQPETAAATANPGCSGHSSVAAGLCTCRKLLEAVRLQTLFSNNFLDPIAKPVAAGLQPAADRQVIRRGRRLKSCAYKSTV